MDNDGIVAMVLCITLIITVGSGLWAYCNSDKQMQKCDEICHPYQVIDCKEKFAVCEGASGKTVVDIK